MAVNILVIDDDVAFIHAATKLLGKRGYVVAGAVSPAAAMDYLTNQCDRFDLIITDLAMPGIDGLRVLRTVKHARPALPVVLVTAFGNAETQCEAARLGAFAFLTKPLESWQLLEVVARAIQCKETGTNGKRST